MNLCESPEAETNKNLGVVGTPLLNASKASDSPQWSYMPENCHFSSRCYLSPFPLSLTLIFICGQVYLEHSPT